MPESKLMSAREAIERYVHDGDSMYVGYTSVAFGLTYDRRNGVSLNSDGRG